MNDLAVITEPASLVAVDDQCAAVEAWAEQCESVPELADATNKLAAIDEYLSRTSNEGRARVAAAMRRLEVRIAVVIGPNPGHGGVRVPGEASPYADLPQQRRSDFRLMATHPEVVETVIAESTDKRPATRNRVLNTIRETVIDAKDSATRTVDRSREAVRERSQEIRRLAESAHSTRQIAAMVGISEQAVKDIARRDGFEIPADKIVGRTHRHDSNRIVNEMVSTLEGLTFTLRLVEMNSLDAVDVEVWTASLSDSLRSLNRFHKQLKEWSSANS